MIVFSCIEHWYVDMLYLAPVALIGGFVARDKLRNRRKDRAAKLATGSTKRSTTARAS